MFFVEKKNNFAEKCLFLYKNVLFRRVDGVCLQSRNVVMVSRFLTVLTPSSTWQVSVGEGVLKSKRHYSIYIYGFIYLSLTIIDPPLALVVTVHFLVMACT